MNDDMLTEIDKCANVSVYPSFEEFYEGIGPAYALLIYAICSIALVIVSIEFAILVRRILHHVPATRRVSTLWVNSIYPVATIMATLGIVLPKSSDFVWLTYRLFLSLAVGHFVDLILEWYGGISGMISNIGSNNVISFHINSCCSLFCQPKAVSLTRDKIYWLRGCVYQMPYVQSIVIFLLVVLGISGYLRMGDLSLLNPYLYLSVIIFVSFFIGLWALFCFFAVTRQYKMLSLHNFKRKSGLFKTMIITINIQTFLIDSMANYNLISCLSPKVSSRTVASIIKTLLTAIQSVIISSFNLRLYLTDNDHV